MLFFWNVPRDRITDAWAKIEKVKRSPDEHRYIFWVCGV